MSRRILLTLVVVLALLALTVAPAIAAEARGGEEIVIGRNEVIDDDVFLAAQTVIVEGTIKGNLFVAANTAVINGTVEGSVFVAAYSARLGGKISGMVMGAAMSLRFERPSAIERNVIVAAYALSNAAGSVVGRDLVAGGFQAQLGGQVKRDVKFAGSALQVAGSVGRNVDALVEVDSSRSMRYNAWDEAAAPIPLGLTVEPEATIGGSLTYRSYTDQSAGIRGKVGSVNFERLERLERLERETQRQSNRLPPPANRVLDGLRDIITLMVFGLIVLRLAPWLIPAAGERLRTQATTALGWGVLATIAGYFLVVLSVIVLIVIGLILAMVTLGKLAGITFMAGITAWGLAVVAFQLIVSYGSKLVVSYVVGKLALAQIASAYAERPGWVLLTGVVIYVVLRSIPGAGLLVGLAATLFGLGALWLAVQRKPAPSTAA